MSTPSIGAEGAEPRSAEPAPKARASLLRASAIMASGTMVSRILGFVRSAMLLAAIGAAGGGVSAAFQTANTLPNTVFNLLASGIFDAVLVPQIVGALKRAHDGETYVNRLLTLAGTLLFVVTIVSMIAAPLLVVITAAGYDSQIRTLAILFALLCLPQLFFYGLYNLLGELLNARGVFGPYMWAPVVNNIVGIAGLAAFLVLWGGTEDRIDVGDFTSAQFWLLGGSATLGVIAQALVLFVPMRRAGVRFTPDFHFRGTHFGSTSRVAGWTFATLGVSQIGVLSTNNLAALADAYAKAHDGVIIAGINAYATAFMIFMVPQSLITVSLTTAIFTRMAESVADGDDRGVAANYTLGIRTITSLTLLAAAILMAGSVPMMQMVLYSKTNQSIVAAYAWILVALMPGVASTGLVLMSQRVFFAYEDVKPVFLMGIGPTIVQVIVGWSMYFLTGAAWWVAAAALGETACRLVQGVIAVVWVSRRNRFVDRAGLLRSYATFLVSAVVAGAVAFGALRLVGVATIASSSLVRFGIATAKMVLVSVVASLVYMLALRVLGPADSARTISPLLARLRVPAPLRALLAAPLPANPAAPGDNEEDHDTTGESMDEDEMGGLHGTENADGSDEGRDLGSVFRSMGSEEPDAERPLPSFDDILSSTDEAGDADPESDGETGSSHAEAPAPGASAWAAAGAALSGWAARIRAGVGGAIENARTPSAPGSDAPAPASQIAEATDDDLPTTGETPALGGAAADLPPAPEDAADATDDLPALPEDMPPAPEAEDLPLDLPPLPEEHSRTGIPAPLEAAEAPAVGATAAAGFDAALAAPAAPAVVRERPQKKQPVYGRDGRRLIDPTKPTLIFAGIITVVGAVWAVSTALAPVTNLDLAQSIANAQQSAQSGAQSGESTAPAQETVAPKISSVSVLSWSNDDGDHPDTAVTMIDGNPDTSWHSRWYDYNQFQDDSNVTIVIKLEKEATVSSITLQMDSSTSGGQLVVRNVTDPANPRGGTELMTTALSPTTEIALPQPVTTSTLALSFRQMPTSVDGRAWAWISELSVK